MSGAESAVLQHNEDVGFRDIDDGDSRRIGATSSVDTRQDESSYDRSGVNEITELFSDEVTRSYLNALSMGWFTVHELAECFDTPLSTAYRKVNELEHAGLLKQRVRVSTNGKHPDEYQARPVSLTVVIGEPSGFEVQLRSLPERRSSDPE